MCYCYDLVVSLLACDNIYITMDEETKPEGTEEVPEDTETPSEEKGEESADEAAA